jgi:hypothetical protein
MVEGVPSVASVVLLAANLLSLARIREFAWERFFDVAKWSLLAYCVIAGIAVYLSL